MQKLSKTEVLQLASTLTHGLLAELFTISPKMREAANAHGKAAWYAAVDGVVREAEERLTKILEKVNAVA